MRALVPQFSARAAFAPALACLLAAAPVHAQATLDRNVAPTPGPAPAFRVPSWTRVKLENGAELVVVPKHDLPLVAVSINFVGGSYAFEPAGKEGLANAAAMMLSEGTATRTAEQISEAQQLLGTRITASVGGESGSIGFTALADKLEPALALVADMLEHPAFPAPALERLRGRSLVLLQQARDNPNAIATNVFARTVYGDAHPYGRITTEASVKAITRDDVVAFHAAYFRPGRAVVTVAGDVQPAAVKAAFAKAFAGWAAGGERPAWNYPPAPSAPATTIELVDKPGAAQSVFAIGLPGPPRSTPDYYALQLMNTLLGGLFQSRLNHEIREVRGWSYGVRSSFDFGHGPGAFKAGGGIITANTDSALVEFFHQFRGVRGDVPFTDDELQQGKAALVQSLPERFSSVNGIGTAVAALSTQELPESYYQDYPAKVRVLTRDDLVRVAKKYVDLDHLHVVIVGDRSVIEAPLRATGIAPIVVLDLDGRPVAAKDAPGK
jgi:predicted Zn-dependent peptidase